MFLYITRTSSVGSYNNSEVYANKTRVLTLKSQADKFNRFHMHALDDATRAATARFPIYMYANIKMCARILFVGGTLFCDT